MSIADSLQGWSILCDVLPAPAVRLLDKFVDEPAVLRLSAIVGTLSFRATITHRVQSAVNVRVLQVPETGLAIPLPVGNCQVDVDDAGVAGLVYGCTAPGAAVNENLGESQVILALATLAPVIPAFARTMTVLVVDGALTAPFAMAAGVQATFAVDAIAGVPALTAGPQTTVNIIWNILS